MNSKEVEITEDNVLEVLDLFTKIPVIILRGIVSRNSNMVQKFQSQIIDYKSQLSLEEIAKIKKVTEMPVPELQRILNSAYLQTQKEQLRILAEPDAEPFITKNLQELKKILF